MASSSSTHKGKEIHQASSGAEPPGTKRKSEESVLISSIAPDVNESVILELCKSFQISGIRVINYSEDPFPSTYEADIRSAGVHIAIFSKRYAESPGRLAELALMRKTKVRIIPVFYKVDRSDLRYIDRGSYADAFNKHREDGCNWEKINEWMEVLRCVSYIQGYVIDSLSDLNWESILSAVKNELQRIRFLSPLLPSTASSSSSIGLDLGEDAFSGSASENSRCCDVFINYRGPDVRDTIALQLYKSCKELGIRAFLGAEDIEVGDSILSTIESAINSASVQIAIFSKGYAESAWCLAELVLMLQSRAKIIPVFYEVQPWELRYIEMGVYAAAFKTYEEKGRYLEKLTQWKEALQSLSYIQGYLIDSLSDLNWESILSAVQNELHGIRFLSPLLPSTASSSSSLGMDLGEDAFSGPASENSRSCDVFINYRGPDVRDTIALQLYKSCKELGIRAFLEPEDIEAGESIASTIESAINSASVQIAIFSKGYAESPWCLAELVLMLESKAKIIPLFYHVNPSDLRHSEKGVYAAAFKRYAEKDRYLEKLTQWKKTLRSISLLAGVVVQSGEIALDGILRAVQKELQRKKLLYVAKYPVGLSELVKELERQCLGELVQDFESQNKMTEEVQGKPQIISIYGMGGVGKTTLSKELYNRYRSKYSGASFLADVRETCARDELPSLQLRLLKDLFDDHHLSFHSTEEGISYLRYAFQRSRNLRFLIVLDDINAVEQINNLLDLDGMNSGSLVLITTRDEQVLIDTNITSRFKIKDMSPKHSRELFCWHAFGQANPRSGYESSVDGFVEKSGFLPLALQIFGGLVRDETDISKWQSYLNEVKQPSPHIKDILKISVDTLDEDEIQVFMDIACFFIDKPKSMAITIWEACGWEAQQALQKLERKSLVRIADDYLVGYEFDDKHVLKMHDHIRDLGRDIANNQSSSHRKWRFNLLESNALQNILSETSGSTSRCLYSFFDNHLASEVTCFLGNLAQTGTCLLWLELDGCEQPTLPSWIPLQQLRSLRIFSARLHELWKNNISQAPIHLRELVLHECSLAECTDSIGILKDLEKLVLTGRNEGIQGDGRALSKSLRGLTKLRILVLRYFTLTGEFTLGPTAYSALTHFSSSEEAEPICSLQSIEMRGIKLVSRVSISGEYCPNIESLHLASMENLIQVDLTHMRALNCLELIICEQLKRVSGNFDLPLLVTLKVVKCVEFEELPSLKHLKCLERIVIVGCEKLQNLTGVEQLQQVRCLHLSGDILRCTHKFKGLPSEATSVIGKASHQAKTILDANQFCNVIGEKTNRGIDVSEKGIVSESLIMINPVCAIIICAVVRGSYASGTNAINICLPSGSIQSNIGGGMWVVTIAITQKEDAIDYKELLTVGNEAQIKKCWMVTINEENGGNALKVFKNIISRLYDNRSA